MAAILLNHKIFKSFNCTNLHKVSTSESDPQFFSDVSIWDREKMARESWDYTLHEHSSFQVSFVLCSYKISKWKKSEWLSYWGKKQARVKRFHLRESHYDGTLLSGTGTCRQGSHLLWFYEWFTIPSYVSLHFFLPWIKWWLFSMLYICTMSAIKRQLLVFWISFYKTKASFWCEATE